MQPVISVIVPVYKVEAYLDRCVQSIVDQTYKNLEIILVDDGSPDKCPQMCDKWAHRDTRIKVIHKENGGPSSARNAGLDVAKGTYCYFVDSDDYIDLSLCAQIMDLFEKFDVDIVTFNYWLMNDSGKTLGATEKICDEILSQETALTKLMQGHINNYAWNKIYKRHVFEGVRFPEGHLWEDMAIAYKLFLNADQIYSYPVKLYYYCVRSDGITGTMGEKALQDIFLARHISYLELKDIYPHVAELVFLRVALSARRLYDRSLWAAVDMEVLADAETFLVVNKEKVLKEHKSIAYKLYYGVPKLYAFLRIAKHKFGNVVKWIHVKYKMKTQTDII